MQPEGRHEHPLTEKDAATLARALYGLEATARALPGEFDDNFRLAAPDGRDITEYKETEAALRESERRYRDLLETMNEGFAIADENGVRTYANQRLCDMLG